MQRKHRQAAIAAFARPQLTLALVVEDGLFDEWRVRHSLRLGAFEARGRETWQATVMGVRRQIERVVRGHRTLFERAVANGHGVRVRVRGARSSSLALSGLGKAITNALYPLPTSSGLAPDGLEISVDIRTGKDEAPAQATFEFAQHGPAEDAANVVRFPTPQDRLVNTTSLAVAFADDDRLFKLTADLAARGVRTIADLSALPRDMRRRLAANDMDYLRLELRLYDLGIA